MKIVRILASLALLLAMTPGGHAQSASRDILSASEAESLPLSPAHAFWTGLPTQQVDSYYQQTVRLNDKIANQALNTPALKELGVKIAYTPQEIGFRVEWKDSTKNMTSRIETISFGDSVALEFPMRFGKGLRLPHVGMGDDKSPVRVYMQRAAEEGTLASEYVGSGFGSLTRTATSSVRMAMEHDEATGLWRAVFIRPLQMPVHSLAQGLVPIAFAVWDGEQRERGGNKHLSSWKFLRLERHAVDSTYQKQVMTWISPDAKASPERGKQLASTYCTACHQIGPMRLAAEGIAPDLSSIGGISTYGYLREAITQPSEVVVHNLNINRHYDPSTKPDAYRAYPNNELYRWFMVNAKGGRTSKMPNFGLPPQDVADIVSYLKTLDGTAGKEAK